MLEIQVIHAGNQAAHARSTENNPGRQQTAAPNAQPAEALPGVERRTGAHTKDPGR